MLSLQSALLLAVDIIVMIGIAYYFTQTSYFKDVQGNKPSSSSQMVMILVFGALAIFGTYSGVETDGAIINIRSLSPMIAGLIGGPVVGLGSGLIGGVHRYLLGGLTAFPCSLTTILGGLLGGLIYVHKKGQFVGIFWAVVFATLIQAFHMIMVALLHISPTELVISVGTPTLVATSLGMLLFALIHIKWGQPE